MQSKRAVLLRAGILAALAAACTENPVGPAAPKVRLPDQPTATAKTTCQVDMKARTVACDDVHLSSDVSGLRKSIIVGGQEMFVRVTSTNVGYDAGTDIFSADFNVQNMIQQAIGTTDGLTVDGVKIFIASGPTVTEGTGIITVVNADGTDSFTGANQPYFNYPEILTSYEISNNKMWQFEVPGTVVRFTFALLISTSVADETAEFLDRVWTGGTNNVWSTSTNWSGGTPVATSTVAVPPAAMITSGNQPTLDAPATVKNLRVGAGSTLDLGGNALTVTSNLDVPGTVTNGSVTLSGASALFGGRVDKVVIPGSVALQRSTVATGAVSVSGSLAVKDLSLTISIP